MKQKILFVLIVVLIATGCKKDLGEFRVDGVSATEVFIGQHISIYGNFPEPHKVGLSFGFVKLEPALYPRIFKESHSEIVFEMPPGYGVGGNYILNVNAPGEFRGTGYTFYTIPNPNAPTIDTLEIVQSPKENILVKGSLIRIRGNGFKGKEKLQVALNLYAYQAYKQLIFLEPLESDDTSVLFQIPTENINIAPWGSDIRFAIGIDGNWSDAWTERILY